MDLEDQSSGNKTFHTIKNTVKTDLQDQNVIWNEIKTQRKRRLTIQEKN